MEIMPTSKEIKVTRDYSRFKQLIGNREADATDMRVKKIKDSIARVGYVPSPVIVNEKMEVIDGNGRLAALRELKLPVYYIVVRGLTIKHCVAMNINSTNWSALDFVNSYADQGNENFVRLRSLLDKHKKVGLYIVLSAAQDNASGADIGSVKNGSFIFSPEDFEVADVFLDWYEFNFMTIHQRINGSRAIFACSVIWAARHTPIDQIRFAEVINQHKLDLPPVSTTYHTLETLSKLYNRNLKKGRVYMHIEYEKWCSEIKIKATQNLIAASRKKSEQKGALAK